MTVVAVKSSALTASTGSLRARKTSRSAVSLPSGRVAPPRPLLATVAPRRRAAIDVLVGHAGSNRSNVSLAMVELLELFCFAFMLYQCFMLLHLMTT